MISLAWKERAIPLYWKILTHKGASNLTEQKAVILPVIRLLKCQKIMITADREFHSIFLSHWLKKYQKPDVYFVFRQKKLTFFLFLSFPTFGVISVSYTHLRAHETS